MLDGGTNYGKGEQLWQPYMVQGTIGGAVFGLAGPLAAWTTCGVTSHTLTVYVLFALGFIFPSLIICEHHLSLVSIYQSTLIGNCF